MDWVVTPVDGDSVTYEWGPWKVTASWPTRSRKDIESHLRVDYTGIDPQLVMSTTRITLTSASAAKGIVTEMRRIEGVDTKELNHFIASAFEDLMDWYKKGQATEYPVPAQRNGASWLIYPIWPRAGTTAVAAAGGSYKSFIAQALALQLQTGAEVMAGNTRCTAQVKTMFLDWEADSATFAERLYALQLGAGVDLEPVLAYKNMRVPLVDAAAGLADEIQRARVGAVVVDSMSAAVGGDLVDAATVNSFFDATRMLGVPVLVLAHKSAENVQKRSRRFFGSIMTENRVRLAWNAEKASDGRSVVYEVFKDNNLGRMGHRLAWGIEMEHTEGDDDRRLAAIKFQAINPDNVKLAADETGKATARDQIAQALLLAGKPLMQGEIADVTGLKATTIRGTLHRDRTLFHKTPDGRFKLAPATAAADLPDPF